MPPKAEKKNNGFDRLRADLKAQTPQNVYLFYGEETYLRSYYLEELHRLLIPAGFEEFNYHRLSGKGLTVQELTEVTEAMPMMAQHTMVVVTDLDIFRLDEQQRTALMALLADFPEYCTLVLVYDLLPYKRDGKMKKLCAALDKSVCEVEFRQQERAQLLRWVKRRFAAAGHDIDDATADHLLFTCGSLMTELVPEIGKIAAYAKGRAVTVEDIRQYRPSTSSISSGQVLQCPYDFEKGRLIVREMTELLVLDLVRKHVVTKQIVLDVGYDRESLEGDRSKKYNGPVVLDPYGRKIPKPAHGTGNIARYTSSTHAIMDAVLDVYDHVVHKDMLIRRVYITACDLIPETDIPEEQPEQLDMFTDYETMKQEEEVRQLAEEKERRLQRVTLAIQDKFGKNALLKGMNLLEGGTTIERNGQIGGHKAGDE